ncbi:SRPBCC family protein [Acetobacteraceae bacterium ESL0709]|nr:SRPBCC family protein [Acetobacteraceae bacterium ESL0697]MDF7678573.1 SRPBCC family protein [Acetobacteraceae bacterium ESL0709]
MKQIQNFVETTFNNSPAEVFQLVTAPRNWKGLHPVTAEVYGPEEINHSLKKGGVVIEHIITPGRPAALNAVWLVTAYEENKLWEITSLYFGGAKSTIKIVYELTPLPEGKTHFKRTMTTYYKSDNIDPHEQKVASGVDIEKTYLENIRKRLS